jgi:hypothetical protein
MSEKQPIISPHKQVNNKTKIYRPKPIPITPKRTVRAKREISSSLKKDKVPLRKIIRKSQTSFLDSDTYQNAYAEEGDGYENVEQDPIQASLSKDIIDPEEINELEELESGAQNIKQQLDEDAPDSEIDLFNEEYVE